MTSKTRISLSLPANGQPRYETLWAKTSFLGPYELLNSSFFLPVGVGDLVEAERRDGRVVVTQFLGPGPMTLSKVTVEENVPIDEQKRVTEGWRAHGASWTEGAHGLLLTVWEPELDADQVFTQLVADLRRRPGWRTPVVFGPADRERLMNTVFVPDAGDDRVVSLDERRRHRNGAEPPWAGWEP